MHSDFETRSDLHAGSATAVRPCRVWVVDDMPDIQEAVEASLRHGAGGFLILESFYGAQCTIDEYAARAALEADALPDVILMDFFLGDGYGSEVTARIRGIEPERHRPIIIAHSSLHEASMAILDAGGDFEVPKHAGAAISEPLRALFATPEATSALMRDRAPAKQ